MSVSIKLTSDSNLTSDNINPDCNIIKTGKFSLIFKKNLTHIEDRERHIFIFGYIQDNEFNACQNQASYFEQSKIIEQITKFNGHFSIVSISKVNNGFSIYSNKSGGYRLYLKASTSGWEISDKLTPIVSNTDLLNKIALEEMFLYRWITGEHSLIEGIHQIPSGHHWQIKGKVIIKKESYYTIPSPIQNEHVDNLKEAIDKSTQLLTSTLNSMLIPKKKIAVLLSGGVDSSILAALANKAGHNLVAISHRSMQHENPELETAIIFAKNLNIEHRIINIDDAEIESAFKEATKIMEQPPRYQSSIILYLLFAKIKTEFSQIIYGEAADTLFGNSISKRYMARYKKNRQLSSATKSIPFLNSFIKIFPKHNKLINLLNEDIESYIKETNELALDCTSLDYLNNKLTLTHDNWSLRKMRNDCESNSTLDHDLLMMKRFILDTDIDNHFHETCSLAGHFNLEIVSPFVDFSILDYSAHLPISQTINCESVKPILRGIGENFYQKELMYLPKKGFPAPHLSWLENSLNKYIKIGCDKIQIKDHSLISTEMQWTTAALGILLSEFEIDFNIAT